MSEENIFTPKRYANLTFTIYYSMNQLQGRKVTNTIQMIILVKINTIIQIEGFRYLIFNKNDILLVNMK